MGKSCHVCLSPNQVEYDKLRLQGYQVKEVWRIARSEYKESHIQLHSFYYHFKHHLVSVIEATEKASKLREKEVEKEIYKTIDASKVLRRNIERCNEQFELLRDVTDPIVRSEIRKIINLSNDTLSLILRFLDKIQIKPKITEEDIFEKIVYCMKDFPSDLIIKFTQRWNEKYES